MMIGKEFKYKKKLAEAYQKFYENLTSLYTWQDAHPTTQAKKFDDGKLRLDLLPTESLKEVAKILQYGAEKYGENNWKLIS